MNLAVYYCLQIGRQFDMSRLQGSNFPKATEAIALVPL